MKKEPQFVELKFKTQADCDKWLHEETKYTISFFDYGQDLTRMWVHESGEILNCNFHAHIYNGRFVNTEQLKPGSPIQVFWEGEWKPFNSLLVEHMITKT